MKCTNCGTEMSDNAKFCPMCGQGVTVEPVTEAEVLNQEEPAVYNFDSENASSEVISETKANQIPPVNPGAGQTAGNVVYKKKKSGKGCIIAIIIVVALFLIGVAGIAGLVAYGIYYANSYEPAPYIEDDIVKIDPYEDFDYSGVPEDKEYDESAEAEESVYVIRRADVTWEQAEELADDYSNWSYLASINSIEEFEKVTQLAYDEGIRALWLGAERDYDEYWESAEWEDDTRFNGLGLWFDGEPSYTDEYEANECYLMAFYVNGQWYLNDAVNDVSGFYAGKIGYIIEEN